MTDWPGRLLDAVNEMTRSRRVDLHGSSMLGQLQADVDRDEDSSPKTGGATAAGGFESRPPGHYAPRELLSSIEHEIRIWVDWLGLDDRGTITANLGRVLGIAQRLNDEGWQNELAELTRDVEKICGALRRYCGLERIFRPRAYCPNPDCPNAHRTDPDILAAFLNQHVDIRRPHPSSSLTVWLNEAGGYAQKAVCQQCGRTWDETTVGLVLDHIRSTSDRPRRSALSGYRRLAQSISKRAA